MAGAVYWIGQDNNIWYKDSGGTRNMGPAGANVTRPDASGFYDPWADAVETPVRFNATQIADPMVKAAPSGSYAGGGATSVDPAQADEAAYWGDQLGTIDTQLGRLPGQRQTADQNVLNSYNSAYTRLTNDKSRNERDYNTNRDQTQQDNQTAKSNIDTGVRNTLTGAQRLLGGRGSGSSSAFSIAAPYAAGSQGNQQRNQVQQTYERNIGGLDTSWKDYMDQWNTSAGDLGAQRDAKLNEERAGFAQTEAGLQEQKQNAAIARAQAQGQTYKQASAMRAPYQARIQQLLSSIDQLGAVPTFTPQAANYAAPELGAYNYRPTGAPSIGANGGNVDPGQAQNLGAFWTLLGGDPRKKQQQPALA